MSAKNKKQNEASGESLQSKPSEIAPQDNKDSQPCPLKKHWIGIKVQDEDGKKVTDVKVNVKLPDGGSLSIDFGSETLESDGTYRTKKVLAPGKCDITFPEVYNLEWWPAGGKGKADTTGQTATVAEGDCALRIAKTLGFRNYHSVWDQSPNQKLNRPNPNQLNVGDSVAAPDQKDKVVTKPVDAVHTFVVKSIKPAAISCKITDRDGKALKGKAWKLLTPAQADGTIGGDGLVKFDDIPVNETAGSLEVTLREASPPPPAATKPTPTDPPTYPAPIFPDDFTDKVPRFHEELKAEYTLKVGSMPSFDTKQGVLARLRNLGFGADVDADDERLKKLVKAYQRFYLKAKKPSGEFADIQKDIRDRHDKP